MPGGPSLLSGYMGILIRFRRLGTSRGLTLSPTFRSLSLEVFLVEVVDEGRVGSPQASRLYQLLYELRLDN